jgi:hypothetical protein
MDEMVEFAMMMAREAWNAKDAAQQRAENMYSQNIPAGCM